MSSERAAEMMQQLQAAQTERLVREIMTELQLDDKLFQETRQRLEQADSPALCLTDRHSHDGCSDPESNSAYSLSRWRTRDRIKTQAAALVLCLNIGVDPPDVVKVSPCARLQCWISPDPQHANKNTQAISKALQAQYERWQPRAKYKVQPDPTVDDLKRLCRDARRTACHERVLFHYNGHGVPQPTANGELWVFNKTFTQYIPVSIHDLASWLGKTAIYVLDCSHAGLIVDALKSPEALHGHYRHDQGGVRLPGGGAQGRPAAGSGDPAREAIILAACGSSQLLPQDADLSADIFTACLTTPIKVAMRWCHSRTMLVKDPANRDRIDRIPGRHTDRKTLLGELNWIFTSITDTIAWNMLPRALFQKLFRQDLLLASLFRNFMLAERIMKACGCQPVSSPRLPPLHQHPLWDTWDVHAEAALMQLATVMADETKFVPSGFFREQLTSFELWLNHSGGIGRAPPQQLPIVLQVLLSQVHRVRALHLLGRFLDMGSPCVELALSVGIFPYVLKLLQTTLPGLRRSLVFIWCKILATDKQCQADIVKDNGQPYFMGVLRAPLNDAAAGGEPITLSTHAECVFVLAMLCDGFPLGQQRCFDAGFMEAVVHIIHEQLHVALEAQQAPGRVPHWKEAVYDNLLLLAWSLLALGKLCDGQPAYVNAAVQRYSAVGVLRGVIYSMHDAELRAAACFALGCFIDTGLTRATLEEGDAAADTRFAVEQEVLEIVHDAASDGSMLVRVECAIAIGRAACVPAFVGSKKRHSGLIAQAFEAQHARVVHEYSAHRNMFAYQPASLQTARGGAPRAPVSEGGLPRTQGGGRASEGRGGGALSATLDPWGRRSDSRTSAPVSRTASASGLLRPRGSSAEAPRRSSSHVESAAHPQLLAGVRAIDKLTPHEEAPLHNGGSDGGRAPAGDSGAISTPGGATSPSVASQQSREALVDDLRSRSPRSASPLGPQDPPPDAPSETSTPTAGENIYGRIAQVLGLLVTDPAPDVARYGKLALLASGHDISHLPTHDAPPPPPSSAAGGGLQRVSSSSVPFNTLHTVDPATLPHNMNGGARAAPTSASSVCSSDMPGAKREPWLWTSLHKRLSSTVNRLSHTTAAPRGGPQQPMQNPTSRARSPAAHTSPTPPVLQGGAPTASAAPAAAATTSARNLATVITPVRAGGGPLSPRSVEGTTHAGPGGNSASRNSAPPQGGSPNGGMAAVGPRAVRLPSSVVFKRLCQHFRRPLKLSKKQRPEAVLTLNVSPAHWGVVDRIERKLDQKLAALEGLRANARRCRQAAQPRLSDSVQTLRTSNRGTSAIALHTTDDAVTAVDCHGVVHVMSHKADRDPAAYHHNCYHVASGQACDPRASGQAPAGQQCTIVSAHILSGLDWPMLMACAADGAVRIWARHMSQRQQKLVTAWQAVELQQSFFRTPDPTVYYFQASQQRLCAVGGTAPNTLAIWDLHREACVQLIPQGIEAGGLHSTSHLAGADFDSGPTHSAVLTGSSDGSVRLFDLRAAHHTGPDLQFQSHDGPLTGLALRRSGILASASQGAAYSEIHFADLRMASQGPTTHHVFKREDSAHKSARLTTLEAHPNAPFFASGNATQVVKLWSEAGEVLTAIRAKSHGQSQAAGIGRTTCMSFAPFDLKLATGASDAHCSVYGMLVDDKTRDDAP